MSEIEKYTAAWFREEGKREEWKNLDAMVEKERKAFLDKFSAEAIAALDGKDILTKLFYNQTRDKENLCYTIESSPSNRELFGKITGGSAYKFGLFFYQKEQKWTSGSPRAPLYLDEVDAIKTGAQIRDYLVEGARIIEENAPYERVEDYERLSLRLSEIPISNSIWVMKYWQMLFPNVFPTFYAENLQNALIKLFKEEPSDNPYIRMGKIKLFINSCGISNYVFLKIYRNAVSVNPQISIWGKKGNTEDNAVSASVDSDVRGIHYWLYSPSANAKDWDYVYKNGIIGLGWDSIDDLNSFESSDEIKAVLTEQEGFDTSQSINAHTLWDFCHSMKEGDIIYVKKGRKIILGKGIVASEYYYDQENDVFKHLRNVNWISNQECDAPWVLPVKTLTDMSKYTGAVNSLNDLYVSDDDYDEEISEKIVDYPVYEKEDFLKDVFMTSDTYEKLSSLLKYKKNIILQGAPGVGKTYAAKRLAYSLLGCKNKDHIEFVQFHQSYSYEDFIMGYRPGNNGSFEKKNGVFYEFCKKAEENMDEDYFFIIDEINRGNLSKIFGELLMLIENDKRGEEIRLLYSNEKFSIPRNLYIIGMMNTSDRSLAMMDYALRRRFGFFDFKPQFESEQFLEYKTKLNNPKFDALISAVMKLNENIKSDESLGEGFAIGHSFFCNQKEIKDSWLESVVECEIIPLIKEYWFDNSDLVAEWTSKLIKAIK